MGFFDEATIQKKRQEELIKEIHKIKINGGVKRAIFNYPIVVVYWNNGDMTVVKCSDKENNARLEYFIIERESIMNKPQKTKANGGVKKVIFNNPATIVYWNDGDKTVVKCHKDDVWNRWAGFAMAVCKKLVCNNDTVKFHQWMKKNCGEEEESTSASVFSDNLSDMLEDLWNSISKE